MRKAIHPTVRKRVLSRFDGRCGYCGHPFTKGHVDHIHPVQRGGTNEESNLMPSCFSCNNYKMTHNLEFFRLEIAESIRKARQYSVNFRFAEKYGLVSVQEKPIKFYFETV